MWDLHGHVGEHKEQGWQESAPHSWVCRWYMGSVPLVVVIQGWWVAVGDVCHLTPLLTRGSDAELAKLLIQVTRGTKSPASGRRPTG